MDFLEIANARQSCRNYDDTKPVEKEKLEAILEAGRLAPSACNSQPYHITVCTGDKAAEIVKTVTELGANKFALKAPAFLVISETDYSKTAAMGARVKHNDFRSIDIGILTAYLTAEANTQGLATCILGWLNDEKARKICGVDQPVRLIISLGYAASDDTLRTKKRKDISELVTYL